MRDTPDETGPDGPGQAANLRFLRRLVTVLTATMILGLVTIVALLVIRFTTAPPPLRLPDTVTLPDGARPLAFTRGTGWYAVVTDADEILIFDAATDTLRQRVRIGGR